MTHDQGSGAASLRGLRVALLTRRLPESGNDGATVYTLSLVRALREQGADVAVWFAEGAVGGPRPFVRLDPELLASAEVHVEGSVAIGALRLRTQLTARDVSDAIRKSLVARFRDTAAVKGGIARSLARRLDPNGAFQNSYTRGPSRRELRFFGQQFAAFRPDVVIADTVFLAPVFEHAPFRDVRARVMLAHDVMYQRAASLASAGVGATLAGWTRAREQAALRNVNVVAAIQSSDAREFAQLVEPERVVELPMPIPPKPPVGSGESRRLLFVGADGETNRVGIRWFIDEVLPLIHRQRPDVVLEVCGSVARRVGEAAGVLPTGWVADLTPHYHAACVVVVPLTIGSGLKIKLTEALAHGRAVVSTSVGLLGVVDEGQPPFGLRADDAGAFADACLRLLDDTALRAKCEQDALRWVRERYAPEVVVKPLCTRIQSLLAAY